MSWIKVPSPNKETGEYSDVLVNVDHAHMVTPVEEGYGKTDIWMNDSCNGGAVSTSLTVGEIYELIKEAR